MNNLTPAQRWNNIKASVDPDNCDQDTIEKFILEISKIDKDTEWSECEPQWWLDMMDFLRRLYKTKAAK